MRTPKSAPQEADEIVSPLARLSRTQRDALIRSWITRGIRENLANAVRNVLPALSIAISELPPFDASESSIRIYEAALKLPADAIERAMQLKVEPMSAY